MQCPRCMCTDNQRHADAFGDELGEFEVMEDIKETGEKKVRCLSCGTEFFSMSSVFEMEILPSGTTGTLQ